MENLLTGHASLQDPDPPSGGGDSGIGMDALLLLAAKVAASACIGMLIGLERSWAHKEAGVRSFAIATLLGTLSWLVSPTLAYVQVGIVLVVLILVNVYAMRNEQPP